MARQRGQVPKLLFPLCRLRACPDHYQRLDNRPNRRGLRHQEDAGAPLALLHSGSEMVYHRPPVVSDQDSTLAGCNLKNIRIWDPIEPAIRGGSEVDCGFPEPNGSSDPLPEVGVGLKADQSRDSPILALARRSLSQRAGFSSASGTLLPSNWCSLSAR